MRTFFSHSKRVVAAMVLSALGMAAHAVILVQTSDAGYYNDSIGNALNGTNGGDTSSGYFPIGNDATVSFPTAPDLSTASAALGNWLTDPLNLNANWTFESSIPNSWAVGTEVAVMYQFNTLGATGVVARFGVDNGIFAWLDGVYIGGARQGGGVSLGEHTFNVGDLSSGTHFLQLLLEDHGAVNGYAVEISARTFTPGPPPSTNGAPEPGTLALACMGLAGIAYRRYRSSRGRTA